MLIAKRNLLIFILSITCILSTSGQNQSVLRQGDWFKLAVTEEGIYKIDLTLLQAMGLNPSSINPQKVRLFGNGGKVLSQIIGEERPIDLAENAIYFNGNADNTLDANEYFLFFGQSSDLVYFDANQGRYVYQNNIYSDTTYYFLNIGSDNGLRMASQPNLGSGFPVINHYDHLIYHEIEDLNVLNSGRDWFGERFLASSPEKIFEYNVDDIIPSKQGQFTFNMMAQSYKPIKFLFYVNDQLIDSLGLSAIADANINPYSDKGRVGTSNSSLSSAFFSTGKINVRFKFIPAEANRSTGYIDNFLINIPRALNLNTNELIFRSKASLNNLFSTFELSGAQPDISIWDVSNPLVPSFQLFNISGTKASYVAETTNLKKFVAFKGSDFPKPTFVKKVVNQNIRAAAVPDLLIVAPSEFMDEAKRLADFKVSNDGFDVLAVTLEEVLNEFSGGSLDVTSIRDLAQYLYAKDPVKFKYILLFGDVSFDFKNIKGDNSIQLIGYESRVSLHPVYTYESDDYFGFLENGEGEWTEGVNTAINHTLDIGVGRLPAKSVEEATNIVNKIIYYQTNEATLGSWRNDLLFVADDGDNNAHQRDSEEMSSLVAELSPEFNSQKVYLDAFENIAQGNSEKVPDATQAITDFVRKGVLIVNYVGHGSEDRWAHESVLTKVTISEWQNKNFLPLFVTATCDFGRHDDPYRTSGGEMLLTEKDKGAIALLATSRPVLSSSNAKVNQAFFNNVFEKINGEWPRLGDVIRKTKNESLDGVNNRNFILLGDPSMRLAYPQNIAQITKINDKEMASGQSQIKSLEKVKVEGIISTPSGSFKSDFNGNLIATVFDKNTELATKGSGDNTVFKYDSRNSVLFRGNAKVVNGKFEFEFIVPKNIDYKLGEGKISLYAIHENQIEDAGGATTDFIVGGSANNPISDTEGPLVELFMNDSTFRAGGKVNSNATLLAKIYDENGINISRSTFGHEINATLNSESLPTLNDYFVCQANTYQTGWLSYPIDKLPQGLNRIELEAWDNLNNSGGGYLEFYVIKDGEIALDKVFNFPNPFTNETEITFEHSRGGEPLHLEISILNSSGQPVKTFFSDWQNTTTQLNGLKWDATDNGGKKVPPGIYILKLSVRSSLDGAKNELSHKMIVLN